MVKKPQRQKTPKGHEIPIPTRADFLRNLEKATEPKLEEESADKSPK